MFEECLTVSAQVCALSLPVSIHRNVFLLLSLAPPLAALRGRMLSPATLIGCGSRRRKAGPANEGWRQLVHHSEVMWSGGGLKRRLNLSSHHHAGNNRPDKKQHWSKLVTAIKLPSSDVL